LRKVEDEHWQSLALNRDDVKNCLTREALAHYVHDSQVVVHVECENSTVVPPPCHFVLTPPKLWTNVQYGSLLTEVTSIHDPNIKPFGVFCKLLVAKIRENRMIVDGGVGL
jgi:hypothetical protein